MLKSLKFTAIALCFIAFSTPAFAGKLNLGRDATPDEVVAWDTDVRPDGQGLPEGRGTVEEGEAIYAEKCATCHGDFGEGIDRWPVLAGGQGSLKSDRPVKTIGSFWPYLSTVFDYINRAMPFGHARSLEPHEVYAITAYLLNLNDIVDSDFELSKGNFTEKRLPNEANFIEDPRPDTPVLEKGKEPCMKDCKTGEVKITNTASVLDVTPEEAKKKGGGSVD